MIPIAFVRPHCRGIDPLVAIFFGEEQFGNEEEQKIYEESPIGFEKWAEEEEDIEASKRGPGGRRNESFIETVL